MMIESDASQKDNREKRNQSLPNESAPPGRARGAEIAGGRHHADDIPGAVSQRHQHDAVSHSVGFAGILSVLRGVEIFV